MSALQSLSFQDKLDLVKVASQALEEELQVLKKSAAAAHEGATHEDAVAKSKYDTHGLELSYLAGSQFERVRKMETDLVQFQSQKILSFSLDDPIGPTALVILGAPDSKQRILYISSPGAGTNLTWKNHPIQILSPDSPLGTELIDSYVGDEISLGKDSRQAFEIIKII